MVGGVDALRQDIYIVQQHNAGCNWKFCQQSMPQYMHFATTIGCFAAKISIGKNGKQPPAKHAGGCLPLRVPH